LLSQEKVAKAILKIILPHLGSHEVVACHIFPVGEQGVSRASKTGVFLGYDIAYAGGDYYSAVRNGLHAPSPSAVLVDEFGKNLNEFGLLENTEPVLPFVRRFKEVAPSEARAEFYVYELSAVSIGPQIRRCT
jgi:hypothetical protein